jgi:hypothetical protein
MFILLLAEGGICPFARESQVRFEFHTLQFFFASFIQRVPSDRYDLYRHLIR